MEMPAVRTDIYVNMYIHVFIRPHINTWDVGHGVYMELPLTIPLLLPHAAPGA